MTQLDSVTRFHGATPRVGMWVAEAAAANSIWARFALNWMGFNALYDICAARGERQRVLTSALVYFDDDSAGQLLAASSQSIRSLTNPPPGDDTMSPLPEEEYRRWGNRHNEVIRSGARPCVKLAHVFGTIYQVRCNLVHGNKSPNVERDKELVAEGDVIVRRALDIMVGGRTFDPTVNTQKITDWYHHLS